DLLADFACAVDEGPTANSGVAHGGLLVDAQVVEHLPHALLKVGERDASRLPALPIPPGTFGHLEVNCVVDVGASAHQASLQDVDPLLGADTRLVALRPQ